MPLITSTMPKANETSNWNIYRNEEYGFEIKYPPNFLLDIGFYDKNDFSIGFGPPYRQVYGHDHPVLKSAGIYWLTINRLEGTLQKYIESDNHCDGLKECGMDSYEMEETRIDGEQAFVLRTHTDLGGYDSHDIYTSRNALVFQFTDDHWDRGYLKAEPSATLARMISTFTFLSQGNR
jgi:hypothetical protein